MESPEFYDDENHAAEVALQRYSKKEAIQRLEEINDPNHWHQVVEKYVPSGILN
jgi:hypothetical protein